LVTLVRCLTVAKVLSIGLGRAQVDPVLGWEVIEGRQLVKVVGDDLQTVGPQVDVVDLAQVPDGEGALLGLPLLGSLVITEAGSPALEPRNCPSAGTKSPEERPRRYSSGTLQPAWGLAAPGRQDRRGEPLPLPGGRVGALVA